MLLAPLAKAAGGYGSCGKGVFRNTKDPDYTIILKSIADAKAELQRLTRFNMPNFRPPPEYIREMKRYGILAEDHDLEDPIDVYETDRKYWDACYPKPVTAPTSEEIAKIK
jgi:hypothetical protein